MEVAPAAHEGTGYAQVVLGALKQRFPLAFDLGFFLAGFLFDLLLLRRIDSLPMLVHQGAYLLLVAGVGVWEHRSRIRGERRFEGAQVGLLHFMLGTLLNAFLVFYFRAGSGPGAWIFLALVAALVVANEAPRFRGQGPMARVALWAFALPTWIAYLLPVLQGGLRSWHVPAGLGVTAALLLLLWPLQRALSGDPDWSFRRAVAPGFGVLATLGLLHVAELVPPVPLHLQALEVVHSVERLPGRSYRLLAEARAPWQPRVIHLDRGERAWAFVRLFSPTGFGGGIQIAWERHERGWVPRGQPFPLEVRGGRDEGWRTYAWITPEVEGLWRVRVLAEDGREIGRRNFEVVFGEAPPLEEQLDPAL